jgi:hypothetical protein
VHARPLLRRAAAKDPGDGGRQRRRRRACTHHRPDRALSSGSYTYALDDEGPEIEPDLPTSIAVTTTEEPLAGPLWVTGGIPVVRSDGEPFETRNRLTLCRCGHSRLKPLCDGTHLEIDFHQ